MSESIEWFFEFQRKSDLCIDNTDIQFIGLVTEWIEIMDACRAITLIDTPNDADCLDIKNEVGDFIWYIVAIANHFGVTSTEIEKEVRKEYTKERTEHHTIIVAQERLFEIARFADMYKTARTYQKPLPKDMIINGLNECICAANQIVHMLNTTIYECMCLNNKKNSTKHNGQLVS